MVVLFLCLLGNLHKTQNLANNQMNSFTLQLAEHLCEPDTCWDVMVTRHGPVTLLPEPAD